MPTFAAVSVQMGAEKFSELCVWVHAHVSTIFLKVIILTIFSNEKIEKNVRACVRGGCAAHRKFCAMCVWVRAKNAAHLQFEKGVKCQLQNCGHVNLEDP